MQCPLLKILFSMPHVIPFALTTWPDKKIPNVFSKITFMEIPLNQKDLCIVWLKFWYRSIELKVVLPFVWPLLQWAGLIKVNWEGGAAWFSGRHHCLPLQGSAVQILLKASLLVLCFVLKITCVYWKLIKKRSIPMG